MNKYQQYWFVGYLFLAVSFLDTDVHDKFLLIALAIGHFTVAFLNHPDRGIK